MDNFIDRITNRFSGQEVIKANAEAEAKEMKKLRAEAENANKTLAEFETCIQEMRKLGLRNAESARAVALLIENAQEVLKAIKNIEVSERESNTDEIIAGIDKRLAATDDKVVTIIDGLKETDLKISAFTGTVAAAINERLESTDKVLNDLRETFTKGPENSNIKAELEGTVHKENVKVYRNVQAALLEETNKLNDSFKEELKNLKGFNKSILILVIIALLVGLGNLGVIIVQIIGII